MKSKQKVPWWVMLITRDFADGESTAPDCIDPARINKKRQLTSLTPQTLAPHLNNGAGPLKQVPVRSQHSPQRRKIAKKPWLVN